MAEEELAYRNISLSFIKQTHVILLNSVKGENKNPGEFRNDQNRIGRSGTPMELAHFVPPNPMIIQEYMEDLEKFIELSHVLHE